MALSLSKYLFLAMFLLIFIVGVKISFSIVNGSSDTKIDFIFSRPENLLAFPREAKSSRTTLWKVGSW